MADHLERRLAALKQRVARLEQQLDGQGRGVEAATAKRAEGWSPVKDNVAPARPVSSSSERAVFQSAEELFKSLLAVNPPKLISYSEAYRRIIGPYDVWRNAVHAPAIVRIACRTSARRVGRLTVRLDALIVGKETRRPAKGHFTNASYSEADWIQTFGTWTLLV